MALLAEFLGDQLPALFLPLTVAPSSRPFLDFALKTDKRVKGFKQKVDANKHSKCKQTCTLCFMPPVDGWWWRAEEFLISLHQGTELKLGIDPAPAEPARVGGLLFAFSRHQYISPRQSCLYRMASCCCEQSLSALFYGASSSGTRIPFQATRYSTEEPEIQTAGS